MYAEFIAGILPPCPEAHEFVWKQRQMQYQDLEGAIHILRRHLRDAPQEEVHLRMYLVELGKLPLDESQLVRTVACLYYHLVAE